MPGNENKGRGHGWRLLAGNSIWNVSGETAPLIFAVFAVPPTIRLMGTERFGILATSWMIVGYLAMLDLGVGRALSKYMPEAMAQGETDELPKLFWAALQLGLAISLVVAIIVVSGSHWAVYHGLKIPGYLRPETQTALCAIGIAMPAIILTSVTRGVLAAFQRFDLVNVVRIPLSVFSYIAPLGVLYFSHNLAVIIGVLVAGRVVAGALQLFMCFSIAPSLYRPLLFDRSPLGKLLGFGMWLTLASSLNPLMVYTDRFLIGSLLSMRAMTYYAIPLEVITKLTLVPSAIAQVMLPALAYTFASSPADAVRQFDRANKVVLGLMLIPALIGIALAPELLSIWLGREFSAASARTAQYLILYVLVTGLNFVPASLISAAGRPDYFARIVLIETPIYLPFAWLLVRTFGISGAAVASAIRNGVNLVLLLNFSRHLLVDWTKGCKTLSLIILLAVCALLLIASIDQVLLRLTVALFAMTAFVPLFWSRLFTVEERRFIVGRVSAIRSVVSVAYRT